MIRDVDERSEDIREAIEQYHHQLEDLQDQLDIRDEKEQQLSICRQEQEEEQHLYETLRLTGEFLQNAKEQFSARYLGPIENGFGKYYTLLTGDKEKDWMVDANIEVQMKEQGEMRETKWLSAGYQDLLGICMRLALVDAMYPKENRFWCWTIRLSIWMKKRWHMVMNCLEKFPGSIRFVFYLSCKPEYRKHKIKGEETWRKDFISADRRNYARRGLQSGTVAGPAGHSGRRYPYDEESRDELCNTWGIFLVNL